MTRFRALTTVLAGVLGVLATMAVVAPPVSAAAHPCSGVGYRVDLTESGGPNEDLRIFFPAYLHDGRTDGGAGYWSCALAQGARNDAVTMLQFSINRCYYPHVVDTLLAEDGDFGSKTKAALVKVQRQHGIEANGQYGPQTARTMYHHYWNYPDDHPGCAALWMFGWPGNSL